LYRGPPTRLRKTEVTFYPWCTGCRIPVHACLFTGSLSLRRGLSGACRCRESNCENENKDRHKAFHCASPSICLPARLPSRILASAGGTYFCQARYCCKTILNTPRRNFDSRTQPAAQDWFKRRPFWIRLLRAARMPPTFATRSPKQRTSSVRVECPKSAKSGHLPSRVRSQLADGQVNFIEPDWRPGFLSPPRLSPGLDPRVC
jgi:hypothetical protein